MYLSDLDYDQELERRAHPENFDDAWGISIGNETGAENDLPEDDD